jgi:hypothetical protein
MCDLILHQETFKRAVMKRIIYLMVSVTLALSLSAGVAAGQSSTTSNSEQEKQKQEEFAAQQKKLQTLSEEEQQKLKQAEEEMKKKGISEKEIQQKLAQIEAEAAKRERDVRIDIEYDRAMRDYVDQWKRAGDVSRGRSMVIIPDDKTLKYTLPNFDNVYIYDIARGGKPGSSWDYSRQVMEATFTNEFTMTAGSENNVNLSVSGTCAEGSISVVIIMPDGKQLSEVLLDENGSLNWRKSFEKGEDNGWKNGKWVFRIKAKDATGNFRISMTSD